MNIISRGFSGRRRPGGEKLPPGQYLETGFPVLSAGPTPPAKTATWQFTITTEAGETRRWDWQQFTNLPAEQITVDIHCVTKWSKLGTRWKGVTVDALLEAAGLDPPAPYVMALCDGGYTTNLAMEDLLDGRGMVAYEYEGAPIEPEHGGPARLLVPHLYFWKSAKWVRGLMFMEDDEPGFWETHGYHLRGDPWKEERYSGD